MKFSAAKLYKPTGRKSYTMFTFYVLGDDAINMLFPLTPITDEEFQSAAEVELDEYDFATITANQQIVTTTDRSGNYLSSVVSCSFPKYYKKESDHV